MSHKLSSRIDRTLWLVCCKYLSRVFLARKKKTLAGSVHPTSVHHHYHHQQYQAWFCVPIILYMNSRLIRQTVGELICNDKNRFENSQSKEEKFEKKKRKNEKNHHVAWFALMQRNMIYRQCIWFWMVRLLFVTLLLLLLLLLFVCRLCCFCIH